MTLGPELIYVEQRFIDQLLAMTWPDGTHGWKWTTGNRGFPTASDRPSLYEVLRRCDRAGRGGA